MAGGLSDAQENRHKHMAWALPSRREAASGIRFREHIELRT
jgi:hypothetical protein